MASTVYQFLKTGTFELPEDAELLQTDMSVPDDTYPVKLHLMKPSTAGTEERNKQPEVHLM
jgi:hypothetical protein